MIKIGSNELAEAYIGSTPIAQINLGSQELWSSGLPVDGKFFQRTTAGGTTIGNGTAKVKKLKGCSGVWNQLCQNKYSGGMIQTHLGGSEYHYTNSNIQDSQRFFASKQYGESPYWIEGHKYYVTWKIKKGSEDTTNHQWYALWNDQYYNVAPTTNYVQYSYIAFGCEGTPLQIWCQFNMSNVLDIYIKDYMCIDLTLLYGAGNEPTTVEQFKADYPLDYYDYNAGTLLNFVSTPNVGELKGTRIASYDSNNTFLGECKLPIASNNQPLILRSAGDVYDEVVGNKVTRRIGVRAYQSDDENDSTLLTDKTNTNYPLAVPTEETIPAWSNSYQAQNGGTEKLLPSNTSVPYTNKVSGEIKYRKP